MERTFVLIKPNVMKKHKAGELIKKFQEEGLKLVALKMLKISKNLCQEFYSEHKEKPFFSELIAFISSFPVIVLAFEAEDAVFKVRKIMGHTDPNQAEEGTLRKQYGDSITANAVHGSDSLRSAQRELDLFFSSDEILSYPF